MTSHTMVAFVLALLMGAPPSLARAECASRSATPASHVVELYTSEGCSSCPPAEKWLRTLSERDPTVVTLEFHVDYWDSLGWHDRFSDAAYTQRRPYRILEPAQRCCQIDRRTARIIDRARIAERIDLQPVIAHLAHQRRMHRFEIANPGRVGGIHLRQP